ncbi:MAG: sensor histidine kinase [Desulfococcaceae bacterium]
MISDILKNWPDILPTFCHDSLAIAIALFEADGELLYANAGMKRLLDTENKNHCPADYLLNPDFRSLMSLPMENSPVFEGILTTGNSQDIIHTVKAKAWRQDDRLLLMGEYDAVELDFLNREMTDLNREISNMQRELIKEKTVLKKTLAELRETQSMLIQSEKMNSLGQLVAGIAHEINNPIAYISSNLHSLRQSFEDISEAYREMEDLIRGQENPDTLKAAETIRKEYDMDFIFEDFADLHRALTDGIARIRKLVTDLRTFSRLDEGEIKYIDIRESLESTLAVAAPELKKRRIDVILDIAQLPLVQCYASELNQVFLNLIINAAQAMNQQGTLKISAREEAGKIRMDFSDNGPGIPEDIIGKIFDPFFTTKPVGSGTGLGLSLAYKIITEKHRGSLSAVSEAGKGAVFTIIIGRELAK